MLIKLPRVLNLLSMLAPLLSLQLMLLLFFQSRTTPIRDKVQQRSGCQRTPVFALGPPKVPATHLSVTHQRFILLKEHTQMQETRSKMSQRAPPWSMKHSSALHSSTLQELSMLV
jgi:hypothetical protein